MNRFKELKVWQKAVELATDVYSLTKNFPTEEKFGIVSQINRSVVSVASNIAEGAGRGSKKEFSNFLSFANGSSYELETQLIIATNLKYVNEAEFNLIINKIQEVQKMIYSLRNRLKSETSQDIPSPTKN